MDNLNHLEYFGIQNIDTGVPLDCDGCSNTFAYILIGASAGTDTIFDMLEGSVRPSMDTLTSYSNIINVR